MAGNGKFEILLGVKLDTKSIRSQIQKYSTKTPLKIGVKLNTKGLSSQIKAINIKTPVKVEMKLNTKNVQKQINDIRRQIKQLGNIKINLNAGAGSTRNGIKNTVNDMNWAFRQMLSIQKNIGSLKFRLTGLDDKKNKTQITELRNQLQMLEADYKTIQNLFNQKNLSRNQWAQLQSVISATEDKLSILNAKYTDTRTNLARSIQIKLDDNTFKNTLTNIEGQFDRVKNKSKELRSAMSAVRNAMSDMNSANARSDIEGLISANERYERALKDVRNQLQMNARQEKANAAAVKLADDRKIFQSKIDTWLKTNSAAAKKFGSELLNLKAQAQSCDNTTLNHLKNEFKRITNEAKSAGKNTQTLGDRLKHQFSKYSMYFSTASAIMYTTQALRDMFNQVVAVDTAMTELRKVTDETNATYNQFLTNAAGRASEIGTTIDGLVTSTADFARLGYEFGEAANLAEVANIYTVVGDEIDSVDTATQSVISTMKAFKVEASDSMSIVDKFNEVSNNFAISSGGIGEALTRSASSLAAANNSLDESIALITASNSVVQDPTVVGTALKTISMRIRGAKTE